MFIFCIVFGCIIILFVRLFVVEVICMIFVVDWFCNNIVFFLVWDIIGIKLMVFEGDFIGIYLVVLLEFISFGEWDLDLEFVNFLVVFSNWLIVGLFEIVVLEEVEDFILLRRILLVRTIFCFICDVLVVMEVGVM